MKSFALSAAVAALLFAAPALAQDNHDKGHGGGHAGAAHPGGGHGGGAPHAAPAAPAAAPAARVEHNGSARGAASKPVVPPHQHISPGMTTTTASPAAVYRKAVQDATVRNQKARQDNTRGNNRQNDNRPDNNRSDNNRHDNDRSGGRNNGNNNHSNFGNNNRGNANSHSNFNRRNVTASHHYRYRGNSWNWPSGYRYQRWSFGMTLPSIFWAQNYWISDYSNYGLGYPPPGTVWVRYNDDAILIDRYTGEILEVVYDQFD